MKKQTKHGHTTFWWRLGSRLGIIKDDKYTYKHMRRLPHFLSEYGGLSYLVDADHHWGYNNVFSSEEDFVDKFIELSKVIIDSNILGLCYTQLYDVEQEQNGLLNYEREHKLSAKSVKKIKQFLTEYKV